jgi:hypothetical protein
LGVSSSHFPKAFVTLREEVVNPAPRGIDFSVFKRREIVSRALKSARRGNTESMCGLGRFVESHPNECRDLLGGFTPLWFFRRAARRGSIWGLMLLGTVTGMTMGMLRRGLWGEAQFSVAELPSDIEVEGGVELARIGGRGSCDLIAWNELVKEDGDLDYAERLVETSRRLDPRVGL